MLKDVSSISSSDIQGLINNSVGEMLTIEYKEQLPDAKDGSKKEFLADISSFANSSGGHIFYGIKDKRDNGKPTGIPEAAVGLSSYSPEEIGRLEQIIRTGIHPRINGIEVKAISGFEKGPVVVIQIPKSWSSPHAVWFQDSSKFWGRSSHGKYQLNVDQIRSAFLGTNAIENKIREFHFDRIASINAGNAPVRLPAGRRLTVHLIPLSSFESRNTWPPNQLLTAASQILKPFSTPNGWSDRINLDGFLRHSGPNQGREKRSYVQLFRNGVIEACDTILLCGLNDEYIHSVTLEKGLISGIEGFLKVQRSLQIELPIVLFVTLEGLLDVPLAVGSSQTFSPERNTIDRDKLFLPEVIIEDYEQSAGKILRPIFDSIYNSADFSACPRYNPSGEYDSRLARN